MYYIFVHKKILIYTKILMKIQSLLWIIETGQKPEEKNVSDEKS
jgi:hypothetical protein